MRRRPILDGGQWLDEYRTRGAYWRHDGNPTRPHALLTSGIHSIEYFNSDLVIEDPLILSDATRHILLSLQEAGLDSTHIDRVVAPAMGAITIAHEMARIISESFAHLRKRPCLFSYAIKVVEGGREKRFFSRAGVREGEKVLVVEDVLMTGQSAEETAEAARKLGGEVLPLVGALVNRTGSDELNGKQVAALVTRPRVWGPPHECPTCRDGSEAIRPKERANWARLNEDY